MKFKRILNYEGKPLEKKGKWEWDYLVTNVLEFIDNYLENNNLPYATFTGIKEKYGGLRLDLNGGDENTYGMVLMAEQLSFSYCENCSNKGTSRKINGWYKTLCDKCFKEVG